MKPENQKKIDATITAHENLCLCLGLIGEVAPSHMLTHYIFGTDYIGHSEKLRDMLEDVMSRAEARESVLSKLTPEDIKILNLG